VHFIYQWKVQIESIDWGTDESCDPYEILSKKRQERGTSI